MIKIAIDAMGSDLGSRIVVQAVRQFLNDFQDVSFVVCGNQDELKDLVGLCEIVHADEVMGMEDGALEVLRRKNTSMAKAISLVADGTCLGVTSAGSTGAFLTLATIRLKLIENVLRAALVSPFPTEDGRAVTILDIGANNENTPEHLVQFARIGSIFTQATRQVKDPAVYLLSNGAEEKKGSPVGKAAHALLKSDSRVLFKGNIEARDILSGRADVVVCEGYPGNVLLKGTEGVASMMNNLIKKAFQKNLWTKLGYLLAKSGFKDMKDTMNYKKYGGAMLLGVNGVVVKGHGSSDDYAFYNAIRVTYELIKSQVVSKIQEDMKHG